MSHLDEAQYITVWHEDISAAKAARKLGVGETTLYTNWTKLKMAGKLPSHPRTVSFDRATKVPPIPKPKTDPERPADVGSHDLLLAKLYKVYGTKRSAA